MKRRNFLKTTMAAPALLQLDMEPKSELKLKPVIMATDWGYSGGISQFCKLAKKEGYDGIEVWWSAHSGKPLALFEALKENDLEVGFLVGDGHSDFEKHLEGFKANLDGALGQNFQKPLYINCHSGKDYFTPEQNHRIIEYAIEATAKSGVEVSHETHRGRMCYSAPLTREFLLKFPQMTLTLDISHWCNVHESLLADQPESVGLALERARHIHLRVGHQEGPQVNDPRAPEWADALNAHLKWWDQVVANRIKSGAKTMTFLTEFGPPNYMPTLPYTRQPVANQWEINVFMMNLIRERYS